MNIDDHSDLSLFLRAYSQSSSVEKLEIEEKISQLYGETGCIMMCDMCNFTVISQSEGIVYYLDLIRQMQSVVKHRVHEHDGQLVKLFADNALLFFDDVKAGVDCISMIFKDLNCLNFPREGQWQIELCVGGCFGNVLKFEQFDMFGPSVNRASILGEDVAESSQLLITQHAFERLSDEYKNKFKLMHTDIDKISTLVYEYTEHL